MYNGVYNVQPVGYNYNYIPTVPNSYPVYYTVPPQQQTPYINVPPSTQVSPYVNVISVPQPPMPYVGYAPPPSPQQPSQYVNVIPLPEEASSLPLYSEIGTVNKSISNNDNKVLPASPVDGSNL
eukprot:jgi/Orpsp1_1/1191765/evm.model.d7180000088371.1